MTRWTTIAAVALGGAAGALARWAISAAISARRAPGAFPLGTFTVNLIGCVALGFCYIALRQSGLRPEIKAAITVGLLGALTTFSTFCLESYQLLESRSYWYAAGNLAGSVIVGMIGLALGVVIAKTVGF